MTLRSHLKQESRDGYKEFKTLVQQMYLKDVVFPEKVRQLENYEGELVAAVDRAEEEKMKQQMAMKLAKKKAQREAMLTKPAPKVDEPKKRKHAKSVVDVIDEDEFGAPSSNKKKKKNTRSVRSAASD